MARAVLQADRITNCAATLIWVATSEAVRSPSSAGLAATAVPVVVHDRGDSVGPGDREGGGRGGAVARGAGETAPLLFTALFSNYWPITNGQLHLMQPTASLAVLIYNFAGMPFENQVELAWAAALVLVLMVLTANLIVQSLSRKQVGSGPAN